MTKQRGRWIGAAAVALPMPCTAAEAVGRLRRPTALVAVAALATALTESLGTAGLAVILTGSAAPDRLALLARPLPVAALVIASLLGNLAVAVVRDSLVANWDAARRADIAVRFSRVSADRQGEQSAAALAVRVEQVGSAASAVNQRMSLAVNLLRTIVYLVAAMVASWSVALVAAVLGGAVVVGLRTFTRRTRAMNHRVGEGYVQVGEQLGDLVGSSRELHQLDRWSTALGRLRGHIDDIRHTSTRARIMADMISPSYYVGMMLIGLTIGWWIQRSAAASTTQLATTGLLLIRTLGGAQGSQSAYQGYQDQLPYLQRLLDFLNDLAAAERPGTIDELPSRVVTLEAERVSLAHRAETVVHEVDVRLAGPGGVAFVGPSGSGKTTLLTALAGFAPATSGRIMLNGVDLAELDPRVRFAALGLSPQHPRVLPGTVRDNLVRADATDIADRDIEEAIERVGLADTVASFGSGLDSRLGRDAAGFSGGELQRLGLARLLLTDAPVWLLDEPTSALDRTSSELVHDLVKTAVADHLVVVVTHRPELVALCRRLVFLEAGRIVDDGSPEEVAARRPFVRAMLDGATG